MTTQAPPPIEPEVRRVDESKAFCLVSKKSTAVAYAFSKHWLAVVLVGCLATTAFGQFSPKPSPPQTPLDRPAAGPKILVTNVKGFGVPFKINADDQSFIEVQLFLSRDAGKTWSLYGRQKTDQQEFRFEAQEDGDYWFALKTLNVDRQLLPSGNPQPELKITVDSVKPTLDFRIQTDPAGRVKCWWQAKDTNLLPKSLKIFYQPVGNDKTRKQWRSVPVKLQGVARNGIYTDQIGWWPDTTESFVNVAVEIKDEAGNATRVDRLVKLPAATWRSSRISTARPTAAIDPNRSQRQPDWAAPSAKLGQKKTSPLTQPAAETKITAETDIAKKPNNVVCENGVCRIIEADEVPAKNDVDTTPIQQLADNMPPVRSAQNGGQTLQLRKRVGSSPEFSAPPVPTDYLADADQMGSRLAQNSDLHHPQGHRAVEQEAMQWPSESGNWQPKTSSNSSTTNQVDSTITPLPTRSKPASEPTTFVPSNPSQMTFRGNKVIGQSTTMGPKNQYRGPGATVPPQPSPTLLPKIGDNTATQKARSDFPRTSHPQFKEDVGQATMRRLPNSGQKNISRRTPFANAGFDRSRISNKVALSEKPNRPTKAPVQIIGTRRFRLNYGIDSIDPSGVGRVNLWMTRDDGKTWNRWGTDPDNKSPFPVEVTEQGRYGFRIVVQSKDGLSGAGPSSGDDADMWIYVDTEAPLSQIKSVPYGRGKEAGRLVINYAVSDNFLTLRPITLSWAATPAGPWKDIETGLRNEGRYVWKIKQQVPDQIFLKITATDRAGNVGRHVLSQAIDVSGLDPRGTIHGVTPVGQ